MNQFFKNKVCIITGSTRGIGRETARMILSSGGIVVLNGRSKESQGHIEAYFSDFEGRYLFVYGNIGMVEDARRIIEKTVQRFGKIDLLINNGGMSASGPLAEMDTSVIREVIDSNLMGSLYMTRFALPFIKETNGSILFISSLAGIHGIGNYTLYSSAKMAYTAVVQSLRKELISSQVHVGITYLSFTENDKEKTTLNHKGELEAVPQRRGTKIYTQEASSRLILNQIIKRKSFVIQSSMGKLLLFLNRLSPSFVHWLLIKLNKK